MRKADFVRILADRKAALTQSRATANGVAGRLFGALVWGREHPYGSILAEEHLAAITLADCKAWVAQLKPDGARLWVAGKVTRAGLTEALEARLGRWTGKAPVVHALAPAPAPSGTIFAVQIDGAVQSMVLVGHPGPSRVAADYEATYLMAMIFGGSFSSRVNMNLREAHGYAYGCRGGFSYRRGGSHWSVSASVETSTTALALREIANEIKTMRTTAPTGEELGRERDGALLALPARFATASDRLEALRSLAFFGLPLDWYAGHQARLAAVEAAAVEEAASAYLLSGDGVVLVVGDLTKPAKDGAGATVLAALQVLADEKAFGAGGLVLLDVDGRPRK
jgi:zinc protease